MSTLEELKNEYELLQKEINRLKLNYSYKDGFSDKEDLKRFINDNSSILEQSNLIREQIKQLEWNLKTPEEEKRQKEIEEKIKKKRGNKSI